MPGWPGGGFGQVIVRAMLGNADGMNAADNPVFVTPVASGGGGVGPTPEPPAGYSVVGDGRKTVATAGTRETLAASTACKAVLITAETDNTGIIVVGGVTAVAALATRRGTPLQTGESAMVPISNLALIYLDTTVNGDGVTYSYYG